MNSVVRTVTCPFKQLIEDKAITGTVEAKHCSSLQAQGVANVNFLHIVCKNMKQCNVITSAMIGKVKGVTAGDIM